MPLGPMVIIVSLLCAVIIAVGVPYADLAIGGMRPDNTSLPFGPVFICFALAALNPLLARTIQRLGLSRNDLLIIFAMALIATAVPTWGLIGQLLPILAGGRYYATPENRWEELLLSHGPQWLAPSQEAAISHFYEGLPAGAAIPWGVWAGPLAMWSVFVAGLWAASIGLMLLLRRPWVDGEHLIYPLMRLPLELAEVERPTSWPRILREPLLWVGAVLALIPTATNGLHYYFPPVPLIPLRTDISLPLQRESMPLHFWFNFAVMGFAYVVSADLGCSLWIFALIAALQTPLMRLAGISLGAQEVYSAGSPAVSIQAMGAMTYLVVSRLWAARGHLKLMVGEGLFWTAPRGGGLLRGARADPISLAEPTHPRVAVLLTLGGIAVMVWWLCVSGLPLLPALVLLGAALTNFLALARATVQGGIPVTRAAIVPQSLTCHLLGSRAIGPQGLASLAYSYAWSADIRVIMMTFVAHGLKLWSETAPRRRGLVPLLTATLAVTAIIATIVTLRFAYSHGGVSMGGWLFTGNATTPFQYAAALAQNPTEPSAGAYLFLAIGAGVMYLLTWLHQGLLWWPLHPLGFAVAATQPIQDLWISIFVGWLLKSVTLRYGGYRAYQRLLPLMLGLILGQALGCMAWLVVDALTGTRGNLVFLY